MLELAITLWALENVCQRKYTPLYERGKPDLANWDYLMPDHIVSLTICVLSERTLINLLVNDVVQTISFGLRPNH